MGCHKPLVTTGIPETAFAIAIGSSSRSRKVRRSCLHRVFVDGVDIVNVEMNVRRQRRPLPLRALATAAHHDHRAADVVFRMESALSSEAEDRTRDSKSLLQKFSLGMYVRHHQVRSYRAKPCAHATYFFLNLLRPSAHDLLLFKFLSQARFEVGPR